MEASPRSAHVCHPMSPKAQLLLFCRFWERRNDGNAAEHPAHPWYPVPLSTQPPPWALMAALRSSLWGILGSLNYSADGMETNKPIVQAALIMLTFKKIRSRIPAAGITFSPRHLLRWSRSTPGVPAPSQTLCSVPFSFSMGSTVQQAESTGIRMPPGGHALGEEGLRSSGSRLGC